MAVVCCRVVKWRPGGGLCSSILLSSKLISAEIHDRFQPMVVCRREKLRVKRLLKQKRNMKRSSCLFEIDNALLKVQEYG